MNNIEYVPKLCKFNPEYCCTKYEIDNLNLYDEFKCNKCEVYQNLLNNKELHTIPEWEKITGIYILDADGFDRTDENLYSKLFSEQEFNNGIIGSTIQIMKTRNHHEIL